VYSVETDKWAPVADMNTGRFGLRQEGDEIRKIFDKISSSDIFIVLPSVTGLCKDYVVVVCL
jgi:hypothetical protein